MLDMAGAKVDLAWDKARKRNTFTFGDGSQPKQKFELPDIVRAQVVRTTVDYLDPLLFLKTRIRIETVRAADTRFAENIRFTGNGTLRDKPFTLAGSLLSPNETVGGGANRLRMTARAGATRLDISGTLPGATLGTCAAMRLGRKYCAPVMRSRSTGASATSRRTRPNAGSMRCTGRATVADR